MLPRKHRYTLFLGYGIEAESLLKTFEQLKCRLGFNTNIIFIKFLINFYEENYLQKEQQHTLESPSNDDEDQINNQTFVEKEEHNNVDSQMSELSNNKEGGNQTAQNVPKQQPTIVTEDVVICDIKKRTQTQPQLLSPSKIGELLCSSECLISNTESEKESSKTSPPVPEVELLSESENIEDAFSEGQRVVSLGNSQENETANNLLQEDLELAPSNAKYAKHDNDETSVSHEMQTNLKDCVMSAR